MANFDAREHYAWDDKAVETTGYDMHNLAYGIEEMPDKGTHVFVVFAADENGVTEFNPGVAEALGRAERGEYGPHERRPRSGGSLDSATLPVER